MASETVTIPKLEEGIELHGIERVSPTTRAHVRIFDNFTMWLSANLVISTVALGALANVIFGLGLWASLAIILIFNALGVLPVAFFSTLGPRLGLRQMTISRFSFGWVGAIIMAIFNVAACIGWSAVNVIIGGQLVAALSNGAIPSWAGILIIAALTTLVSIYGYKYVHRYERYAWIPMAIIFLIILIVSAPHFQIIPTPALNAATIAGMVSFGAAIYGFATGWSSYAADYNVNQPEETPVIRVFWLTFLGVFIPCVLLETFGVLLTSVSSLKGLLGGDLLAGAVTPLGTFGKIIVGLLTLSVIANNIPNDYSLGLSMQVLGKWFERVNRAIWTLIGAVLYIVIALLTSANFGHTLESFLLIVAYWLGPWATILILEHFVFRRRKYNVDDWDTSSKLPIGWAAIISMAIGLVGVVLGAAQVVNNTPVVGPIARLVNPPYGMDVGFELGVVLAATYYLILRPLELNITQR
jgi:NCS1 nucleoside transporter family